MLKLFNKTDLVPPELAAIQVRVHQGVAISAIDESTLTPLIARLEEKVEELLAGPGLELTGWEQISKSLRMD